MPIPLHVSRGPLDLVDTMLECHARIRSFVEVAKKIGTARESTPSQVASAAADVQRYFRHGLPLHVEDEEKSLIPRLRGRSAELDAALAAMEAEHREHEAPLARLLATMDELMVDPSAHARIATSVTEAAEQLGSAFEHHLGNEERKILPHVRTLLSKSEQSQILAELRARRAPLPPGVARV